VIKAMSILEKCFQVICVKNGYNSTVLAKGSGYRDVKLLIEVEFQDLKLGGVTSAQPKTKFICEVQIICQQWLKNKKNTSMSYKILRAQSFRNLLYDLGKYVTSKNTNNPAKYKDVNEIIKNGWLNLAKAVNCTAQKANSLLLTASHKDWSTAGVSILVKDFKANVDYELKKKGNTALTNACINGLDDLVELLIQLSANIDHRTAFNSTGLHCAAGRGHEGCVRRLLSAKASVGVTNNAGKTALDKALEKLRSHGTQNYNRIVKLLRGETVGFPSDKYKTHSKLDDLRNAAIEGSLARFFDDQNVPQSLISELFTTSSAVTSLENTLQILWFGGNVEQKDEFNKTPLYLAVLYGTQTVVNVLLEAGAPVDVTTLGGKTPLFLAVERKLLAKASLLLEARAAVNVRNKDGITPLLRASCQNNPRIVSLLLEAKSDNNAASNNGWTSLLYATRYGTVELVSLLLDAKSEINARANDGWTPLLHATRYGTHEMVSLLLEAKAEINAKTDFGMTPLLLAVRYGNASVVAEVLKFGANIHDEINGKDVYEVANDFNKVDRKNVLNVLEAHRQG
jgi:ankyrin repeat protein